MLQKLFKDAVPSHLEGARPGCPTRNLIDNDFTPREFNDDGLTFQANVFATLYKNKSHLEIKNIYQLQSSACDGLLELIDENLILFEIKLNLDWGNFTSAVTQILIGKQHQNIKGKASGLIIFNDFSPEKAWGRYQWGQAFRHARELSSTIDLRILQIKDSKLSDYNGEIVFEPEKL